MTNILKKGVIIMCAGFHECRCTQCRIALKSNEKLPHVVHVPNRPLTESLQRAITKAFASMAIARAFSQLAQQAQ